MHLYSKASIAKFLSEVTRMILGGFLIVCTKSMPVKLGMCMSRKTKSTVSWFKNLIASIAFENSPTIFMSGWFKLIN